MTDSYDEYRHPARRAEDRAPARTRVDRQINVTVEAGAVANGGTLIICMDSQDAANQRKAMQSDEKNGPTTNDA